MDSFRHLIGLLGQGISPAPRSLPTYLPTYLHKHREAQTHIHAPSRIRTCAPNVRAAEDSIWLRPRGYWDRPPNIPSNNIVPVIICDYILGPVNDQSTYNYIEAGPRLMRACPLLMVTTQNVLSHCNSHIPQNHTWLPMVSFVSIPILMWNKERICNPGVGCIARDRSNMCQASRREERESGFGKCV
jgi:hypothetical protein